MKDQRTIGFIQGVTYAAGLLEENGLSAEQILNESGIKLEDMIDYAGEHDLENLNLAFSCQTCDKLLSFNNIKLSIPKPPEGGFGIMTLHCDCNHAYPTLEVNIDCIHQENLTKFMKSYIKNLKEGRI